MLTVTHTSTYSCLTDQSEISGFTFGTNTEFNIEYLFETPWPVSRGALTAVLLGDPLGGEGSHGAAGLSVCCQRATDLSLAVIVAAVQVAGLVEGPGVQQAMAGLEEALQLGELLTGVLTLERQHGCVVTRLSQSHVLGLITTREKRQIFN